MLVKFADDITRIVPITARGSSEDDSSVDVQSFIRRADKNRMTINLKKTWELLLRRRSTRIPPEPLGIIDRKDKLTLLGVTMNWDTQFEYLLSKASSRSYILRVCRYYKYSISSLDLLFQSSILSIFIYGIKVCGNAFYSKYFSRIDKFFARALKSGYCIRQYYITDILKRRDFNCGIELLPQKLL